MNKKDIVGVIMSVVFLALAVAIPVYLLSVNNAATNTTEETTTSNDSSDLTELTSIETFDAKFVQEGDKYTLYVDSKNKDITAVELNFSVTGSGESKFTLSTALDGVLTNELLDGTYKISAAKLDQNVALESLDGFYSIGSFDLTGFTGNITLDTSSSSVVDSEIVQHDLSSLSLDL